MKEVFKKITYAGSVYDIIAENGEKLVLRSVTEKKLIIECRKDSFLLKEVKEE